MTLPAVVAQFGVPLTALRWKPAAAGFSGALIWRGSLPEGEPVAALKAYPPDSITPERLTQIHRWLQTAGDQLPFVPSLFRTNDGASFVSAENRLWEATRWQSGTADFHARPSPIRVQAACTAIAKLHQCWARLPSTEGPIPGIERRLAILADVLRLSDSLPALDPTLTDLICRGREQILRLRSPAMASLAPWVSRPFRLQPCLCDLWHDHVLFTKDEVTGIIDYGAMKLDHPAVDLARLLGSLVPGEWDRFALGLEAYRVSGGVLDVPDELVRILAETGILGSVAGWLLRLASPTGLLANPAAVAKRLAGLVAFLEALPPENPFRSGTVSLMVPRALQ